MENIMKEFMEFVNDKEKKNFKEEKEKAIKNAMEVMNGAEMALICASDKQTSVCGDAPSVLATVMSLIYGLVQRGSVPANMMEDALLEVIRDFKGQQDDEEEFDLEKELKNKLEELMNKIEKM